MSGHMQALNVFEKKPRANKSYSAFFMSISSISLPSWRRRREWNASPPTHGKAVAAACRLQIVHFADLLQGL
jgi:hypothetical protein